MGNCTPFCLAFPCTHERVRICCSVVSFSLFLLPFCSAPCLSNAPSSDCISAHTQGTLASLSLSYGVCRGPATPSSHFTNRFQLCVSFQLYVLIGLRVIMSDVLTVLFCVLSLSFHYPFCFAQYRCLLSHYSICGRFCVSCMCGGAAVLCH